ncbi:MAG TPA: glycosyltransferase [Chloroflexota bacterium]
MSDGAPRPPNPSTRHPRLRVAMLSKALVVGAYQKKAEELARLPGVELTVLVPPRWSESGRTVRLERRFTAGYELVELPFVFDGHHHVHFYPTLWRELERLRPDVLHVDEEPYNLATFLAYLDGGRVGAKRLFFSWQNLYRRYPAPFRWMERWVLANSDGAIAGVTAALDVFRRKGYRGPTAVIPQFGFDPELFSPAPERRPRPFTIGYLGRLQERKGLLDLVEACAGLPGDWRLRFVGSGDLGDRLLARAGELAIGDRVEVLPPVGSTEVVPVYRGLDVVALPSRTLPSWKEQFGRILPEGMACGAIPLGSDSGEIPHVIGDAGLVFPEGDVAALRAHLQRLMDDPALRDELVGRARARFLGQYTQARIARATHDFYRSLLKSDRASASD